MPPLSAWQQTRVFPLPERRSGCCRAQPHPSSSPAWDFTAEAAQQPVTRLPKEELKLQGPGRPAPPAHHTGPDALRGQSCLLQAAGRDPSASRPRAASLCLPSLLESTSTQTMKRPGTGSPLTWASARPLLAAHLLPPLPPKQWLRTGQRTSTARDVPTLGSKAKWRPSVSSSCLLHCLQTRTLGWDWGFFSCLLHRQEAGRRGTGDGKRSCPLGGGCDMEVWAWTQGTGQGCP